MAKCPECGAIIRRDDEYQDTPNGPTHAACLGDRATAGKTKTWDADNGEADDEAARTEEPAEHNVTLAASGSAAGGSKAGN